LPEAEPQSHLQVEVRHRAGSLQLAVEFALERPWTVLFGPSGSGKTTILRMIAGLLAPERGTIVRVDSPGTPAESRVVFDSSKDKVHLGPHRRRVGFAPQQASVFPHLSVRDNLAYGLRSAGDTHLVDTDATLAPIAELLRISGVLKKHPGELSGGEAQRVNLARACASALRPAPQESRMLLLDEPLTGLDLRLRDDIAADLRTWAGKRGLLVLSVTHEVGEVFQLGAEVLRLGEGTIVQRGPAQQVLAEERARLLQQLNSS
jgi:molybdate transport system ATP-binding protein